MQGVTNYTVHNSMVHYSSCTAHGKTGSQKYVIIVKFFLFSLPEDIKIHPETPAVIYALFFTILFTSFEVKSRISIFMLPKCSSTSVNVCLFIICLL